MDENMNIEALLQFGNQELRKKNIATIMKYVHSKNDEERKNRWKLFTEDCTSGFTGPEIYNNTDKVRLNPDGREAKAASDAWNHTYFPDYHMENNILFQTQDPNYYIVVSQGNGYIHFPAYGEKKPYENFFFHRFIMRDGLIKDYREHMNFCQVFHALGVELPQIRFPGKPESESL